MSAVAECFLRMDFLNGSQAVVRAALVLYHQFNQSDRGI